MYDRELAEFKQTNASLKKEISHLESQFKLRQVQAELQLGRDEIVNRNVRIMHPRLRMGRDLLIEDDSSEDLMGF